MLDAAMRPYKLLRHTMGDDPAEDPKVYHETDEAFVLSISRTRSQTFLLMPLHSATSMEVHYLPAGEPTASFVIVQPRQPELEYSVEHHGDRFLIVTNDGAINFKLVEAPISTPAGHIGEI